MKKVFLLKLVLSLALLLFLVGQIDVSRFFRALASARPYDVAIVLFSYIISQIVSCVRWAVLAHPLGFKVSFREYLSFYFIGMFFNLFAPSTVGGDASRVFYLAQEAKPHEKQWRKRTTSALISVLTDRVIGMAVLVWIGAGALLLFPAYQLPALIRYLTYACSLGFIVGWFMLPFIGRVLSWRGSALGEYLGICLDTYWTNRRMVLYAMLLSLVVHFMQSAMHVLLGHALKLEMPWSYGLILYPLVGLFSALPLSVNGIGLRENGFLFLLRHVGVSSEKAVAFGLLWFLVVALNSLIGGVVYILRRKPRPTETSLREDIQVR